MTCKRNVASLLSILALASSALAQSAPTATENKGWETSAALGFSLAKGNSDNMLLTGNLLGSRKWGSNELDLGLDGQYGETDGEESSENIHAFGQYNYLFTDRAFGYLRLDALHDGIAEVDYRVTLSPGVGYYFIKSTNTFLRAEVGPGFVAEKQGGVEDTYISLRLAERFEHKFNARFKLWQSLEWLPQIDDFNNYILNAEIGIDAGLTEKMSLRAYLQDTFDNEPAPGMDKNDIKLVTAIAYKF